ncbi:MAG: hypothetical protein ACLTKI_05905 [Lachnospiraceae bacterium]
MKKQKKIISTMIMAVMLAGLTVFPSMASRSVITSVSIKVELDSSDSQDLPDDPSGSVTVNSSKYDVTGAEWETDIRDVTIGDTPRMKVWLSPGYSNDDEYYFRGSYSSSNVKISGGLLYRQDVTGMIWWLC